MNEPQQTPVLNIKLKESHYGHGTIFDSIRIEPTDTRQEWIEPEIVLLVAFVENVLGYSAVGSREGGGAGERHFKREMEYAEE